MIALMVIGLSAIRVSEQADVSPRGLTASQLTWAAFALVGFVVMTVIPYQRFGRAAVFG